MRRFLIHLDLPTEHQVEELIGPKRVWTYMSPLHNIYCLYCADSTRNQIVLYSSKTPAKIQIAEKKLIEALFAGDEEVTLNFK